MSSGTLGTFVQAVGVAASFIPGVGWGIRAGIAIGTSLLGGYLKSRGNMAEEFDRGADINVLGNEAPLPVIYGRTKIAPAWTDIRVDTASENDGDLWLVGALAVAGENGDGIEEVESILLNDVIGVASPLFQPAPRTAEVTPAFEFEGTDRLAYGLHDGSDDQVLDTGLDATFSEYTADDVGRGIATIVLRLTYTPEVFQGGIPRVSAIVKGNKVWDPRASSGSGAWEWSDNPALCILDYLTSKRYGLGAIYAERDGGARTEIDEASFIAAANYCDETVSVPGSAAEARFTLNGAVDTGRPIRENMRALLTSCRGELVYEGGVFRLVIRRATTAEAVPIAQSDIVGAVEYWRAGTEQAPNRVVCHYVDEDNGWQAQEVAWPEPGATNGFLTADNGFENTADIQLPFTVGYHRAQRLGMVFVREQREDGGIAITVKEKAVRYQIGSVVEVTLDRAGFDAAEYRVRAIALNENSTVRLALQEYDAAAYSLDAQNTRDTLGSGGLPDASTIAVPTSVTATSSDSTAVSLGSGIRVPRIRLDWTGSVGPFLRHYEVRIRESSGPGEWRATPDPLADDVQTFIESVTSGTDYDIQIRAVSTIGVVSAWVTVSDHTVDGEGGGPILSEIADVIGTPEDVDGLIYDAAQEGWVARPIVLQDLGDVTLSTLPGPSAGQAFMYSGSVWQNRALLASDIPNLAASKITSGVFSVARGGTGAATWTSQALLVGNGASAFGTIAPGANGTFLRSDGTSWSAGTIIAADVPGLPASNITSGTFAVARIPNLAASIITSGTFAAARIPSLDASKITTGTFGTARIPDLSATKITSGTLPVARGGTGAATWTAQALLVGNGASAFGTITPGANGTYLRSDGTSWSAGTIIAADIPGLPASAITSGTFATARIPDLNASKIDAGTFGAGSYTFPGGNVHVSGGYLTVNASANAFLSDGDVLANGGIFAVSALDGNIDHIWHDDSVNTWHFCSDTGRKNTGNSTIRAGAVDATGNVRSSVSDRRLKNRVERITGALDRIEMLTGVTHGYTAAALKMNPSLGRKDRVAGVFSQDVERALSEALDLAPFDDDGRGRSISGEWYQTVDYGALVPLLVEGLKELRVELRSIRHDAGV